MDIHDIEKIELERQEKTTEQKLKKQASPKEKLDIYQASIFIYLILLISFFNTLLTLSQLTSRL